MKKKCFVGVLTGFLVFGLVGLASAYTMLFGTTTAEYKVWDRSDSSYDTYVGDPYFGYTGDDYAGYYIGTFTQPDGSALNDNKILEDIVTDYLGMVPTNFTSGTSDAGDVTITSSDGWYSGMWSVAGIYDPEKYVNFYSVKASNEFALYFVDPQLQTGEWTTRHTLNDGLNIPTISHLSVSLVGPPTSVPEPAMMLLFGTSLVGLVGVARRRNKK
ncbi:PEP-CTERM sorting domain-containing protein [Desulfocastanea catecholica]